MLAALKRASAARQSHSQQSQDGHELPSHLPAAAAAAAAATTAGADPMNPAANGNDEEPTTSLSCIGEATSTDSRESYEDFDSHDPHGAYNADYIRGLLAEMPPGSEGDPSQRAQAKSSKPRLVARLPKRRTHSIAAAAAADPQSHRSTVLQSSNASAAPIEDTICVQSTPVSNDPNGQLRPADSGDPQEDARNIDTDRAAGSNSTDPLSTDVDRGEGASQAEGAREAGREGTPQQRNGDRDGDVLGQRAHLLTLETIQDLVRRIAEGTSLFGGAGLIAAVAGMGLYEHKFAQASATDARERSAQESYHGIAALGSAEMEEFAKLARWATTYPNALGASRSIEAASSSSAVRTMPRREGKTALKEAFEQAFTEGDVETPGEANHEQRTAALPGSPTVESTAASRATSSSHSFAVTRRPDAFDANDRERWVYQEAKLTSGAQSDGASAIVGSTNSKKRKVPAAYASHSSRDAPSISRRNSSASQARYDDDVGDPNFSGLFTPTRAGSASRTGLQASDHLDDWTDPLRALISSLADLADPAASQTGTRDASSLNSVARGTQTLVQALHCLTNAALPPGIYRRMRHGHTPSSRIYQRYAAIQKRKESRLSPYVLSVIPSAQPEALPTPASLLPSSRLLHQAGIEAHGSTGSGSSDASLAPASTAKKAAKAAKKAAKSKQRAQSSSSGAAISTPSSLPIPTLSHFYDQQIYVSRGTATAVPVSNVLARSATAYTASACPPYSKATFDFACQSERLGREFRALSSQKQQLLTLLRLKRKESLLRRKQELEEEKDRLSRVLAENIKAASEQKRLAGSRAPAAQLAAAENPGQIIPAPLGTPLTTKPPLSKKGKKKRSAHANANNVHHRQNYVPSRLPASANKRNGLSDGSHGLLGGPGWLSAGGQGGAASGRSKVLDFGPDEWMCMFCEYELWYGSKPQLSRCVKKRKKVLKIRQKAIDRAKGAIAGPANGKATINSYQPPPVIPRRSAGISSVKAQIHDGEQASHVPGVVDHDLLLEHESLGLTSHVGAYSANGISQVTLLSYHCLAKNLPQPVYHTAEMRDTEWHDGDEATRRALGSEEPWQAVSIELNGYIYKRAILTNERRKLMSDASDEAPPFELAAAKEDVAERVLRFFLTEEKLVKALDGYSADEAGLVVYKPGETEFVVNLRSALALYNSAWSLLQEYCRLDGLQQPSFVVEHINDRYIYSMSFEEEKLMTDVGREDEAREDMSLRLLDSLQQRKSTKLSQLIAKSKQERNTLKAETAQIVASKLAAAAAAASATSRASTSTQQPALDRAPQEDDLNAID